jgi:hypothetical protein
MVISTDLIAILDYNQSYLSQYGIWGVYTRCARHIYPTGIITKDSSSGSTHTSIRPRLLLRCVPQVTSSPHFAAYTLLALVGGRHNQQAGVLTKDLLSHTVYESGRTKIFLHVKNKYTTEFSKSQDLT